MRVAVITPWLDHLELWPDYRDALELGPYPDDLIIVDNGSDPPLDFAQIRNDTNLGFCKANNQGLADTLADIVVFLNNDVWASAQDWLSDLCDGVEPDVLVGARLRTGEHANVDGHILPYLDGWCLAGRTTDLLVLGGFDEQLEEPAYYSDNLLSLEARAAGMTLREMHVGIHHRENVTARDNPDVAAATAANRRRYEQRARQLLAPKGAS
jgi:GT2 family glycosyltransferase